jgi:resuscitation-promoting factor RpfB
VVARRVAARRSGIPVEAVVAFAIVAAVAVATGGKLPGTTASTGAGHAPAQVAAAPAPAPAGQVTVQGPAACGCTVTTMPGKPNEQLADKMAAAAGWDRRQRTCLDLLWTYESASTWSPTVTNPTPGAHAYGIPQALPADKMAAAGPDWRTSPATQIRWGLSDIASMYGSPCGAWDHELSDNWY